MYQISRRNMLLAAGGVTLLSGAKAVCAADPITIRFGVLYPNLTTLIHQIATKTGAYERHGIKIVETRFKSGQTVEGVEQLWRGRIDFYMGGAPEVPRLNSRLIEAGSPPPLAIITGANPGHTSLVLGTKIKADSLDQLFDRPLRIGVSSLSSVHLAFFRGYMKSERKIDPNSIKWRFIGLEAGNMMPALLTSQIDGFLHSEPTTTLAVLNGAGSLFANAARGDFGKDPPPSTFIAASRATLAQKPDMVRRFLAALFDANEAFAKAPKAEMIAIIGSWSGQEDRVLDAAYGRLNPQASMTHAQAQRWWDFIGTTMVERGELSPKMAPFEHVFELGFQPT